MMTTGNTEDTPHIVTACTTTSCEDGFGLGVGNDAIISKN